MFRVVSEPSAARRDAWAAVPPRDALLLALITLAGLGVRLYGLTGYGIWFDEGYHIALVRLPTVGAMLDAVLSNPPSDPMYVLLLRGWVTAFGSSDAAVRSLSVILSTATLPATYALGRVMAGRAVGLLGATMFALSPYAVEFGQEAALYSLAALATTVALAAGWHWWARGRGWLLYVALGIVAMYSNYVVAAILALFAAFALHPAVGPRRVAARPWLLAHAAIFTAWLPWLVALLVHWQTSALPRVAVPHPDIWRALRDALIQYTSGTASLQQSAIILQALGLLAGAVLLALGLVAATRGMRLLAAVATVIFFAPAVLSALTGLWLFVSHFMLFLLPSLMLVLASGALFVLGRPTSVGAPLVGALLVYRQRLGTPAGHPQGVPLQIIGASILALWFAVQLAGLWLYYQYPPHGADGLRELAAALRESNRGDPVLVTQPVLVVTLRQYYPGNTHGLPADFDLRAVYSPYDPNTWNADALKALETQAAGHNRFWLVYRRDLDDGGNFLRAVQARYRQALHKHYEYADLYLFTR